MKAGILITARLKSSRLPKKVIRQIMGKPMIVHMIDRLKLSKKPEMIVLNTSTNPQDDLLESIARREKIRCFRGHEKDVLLRIYDAAKFYSLDTVISCTADNPFVDPEYIDKLLDYHISQNNDYTNIKGLPLGVFTYAINTAAIERVFKIKDATDTEVWGPYFTETGLFKTGCLEVDDSFLYRPQLRLTVDYQEDFDLVTKIFEGLYDKNSVFSLREILQYLDNHPDLLRINMHIVQRTPPTIKLKTKLLKSIKHFI